MGDLERDEVKEGFGVDSVLSAAESFSSTTSSFGSLPSLQIRDDKSTVEVSTMDSPTSTTSSLGTVPSLLLNWEDDSSADESLEIVSLSVQSQDTPTTTTHDMTATQPDTDGEVLRENLSDCL